MRWSKIRQIQNRCRYGLFIALVATLLACGPTVQSQLPRDAQLPASIALLPSDYSIDIPRERVNLVRQAVINELRNHNFLVLDDGAVNSLCSTPACPERSQLSQRYLVDGFATLNLKSFSRNNFVAGYYNQLSGELLISDRAGKTLISVEDTQNEEGGLLLQSGQIFQAIISSVKNTGDSVFDKLSDKFARTIVEQLPQPATSLNPVSQEGITVALSSATATWSSPTTYTICARGTPHSFAYLVTGKTKTSLREGAPGTYCENFSPLVSDDPAQSEAIELRSAFGTSIRQEIAIPAKRPCDMKDRVSTGNSAITVACTQVGSSGGTEKGCSSNISPCKAERIVLFKASGPSGPFEKIGESASPSAPLPPGAANIQVITIGPGGIASLPAPVAVN